MFLGAAVMEVKKATVFASVLLLTFMLAGGYYISSIPSFISWIKYVSFTYYAYQLVLKMQFYPSQTFDCGPPSDPSSLSCSVQEAPAFRAIPLTDAWVDALALLAQVVLYRLLAYVALRRMKIGQS